MNIKKPAFKYLLALLLPATILWSCGNGEDSDSTDSTENTTEKKEAKGGKVYGGTFDISETEAIASLYPPEITAVNSANIATQIYEGLLRFNPKDLSVMPSLAESWVISEDGTEYTMKLKKGVLFHDNPCFEGGKGREMKASDVVYSFELLCGKGSLVFAFLQDRLKGANTFHAAAEKGEQAELEGVQAIDDYTVKFTLEQPFNTFAYILANPAFAIIPKEAIDKYGKEATVGTGAFVMVSEYKGEDVSQIAMIRNPNYHRSDSMGNQLPFLDSLIVHIIDSKKAELEKFKEEKLDVVKGLPSESIREIVEEQIAHFQNKPPKYILDRSPEMGTSYYIFNLTRDHFKKPKVRQAFNYAINRNRIIDQVLNGEAYGPAQNGVSPPAFKGYDITKIQGYSYDLEKAKKLMAEAGYPNGKNFPTIKLELNSGGYKNTSVAFEIQKQLMENLNVNIDLEVVPFEQKLEDERYARADIFRSAWNADYPNPETFLNLFYGKPVPASTEEMSYPNTSRYVNKEFDNLYIQAVTEQDKEKSYALLLQAEQLMIEDAPLIPLWYQENYRLIQSYVRNYHTNPMNYRNFANVYFKELKDEVTKKGQ